MAAEATYAVDRIGRCLSGGGAAGVTLPAPFPLVDSERRRLRKFLIVTPQITVENARFFDRIGGAMVATA